MCVLSWIKPTSETGNHNNSLLQDSLSGRLILLSSGLKSIPEYLECYDEREVASLIVPTCLEEAHFLVIFRFKEKVEKEKWKY